MMPMQPTQGLTGTPGITQPVLPAVMGKWQSNADIQAAETAAIDAKAELMRRQTNPVVTSLAGHFRTLWEAARDHKQRNVEPRLLQCLMARKGEYSAEQLRQIQEEGSPPVYMMLTDEKCSNFESWLHDIFDQPDDLPFGADETPVPEIEPQLMAKLHQAAIAAVQAEAATRLQMEIAAGQIRDRAHAEQRLMQTLQELMEDVEDDFREVMHEHAKKETEQMVADVKDVAVESGWKAALLDSFDDFSTYPCSFIKGPCAINKSSMEWEGGKPVATTKAVQQWRAPSPWDIFPGPDNSTCQDGYLIERHYLQGKDLTGLIGVEGYDDEAIRAVIREQSGGGLRSNWLDTTHEPTRQRLEGKDRWMSQSPEPMIPALQIWADVPGYKLLDYGMSPDAIPDATRHYPVEGWLIGGYIIKLRVNSEPDGWRPYFPASFRRVKGSFWGKALPEVIADCQAQCNVAARALARNVLLASGPQAGVDIGAMPPGESIDEMHPLKIWQFDMKAYMGGSSGSRQPLWFFQPALLSGELQSLYEFWNGEADNKSGIPRYATGGTGGQQGVLRTSSGYAMMLEGATKAIKRVAKNIDSNQIEPSIQRVIYWLLLNRPGKYRGDIKIKAVGATALLNKQATQLRRTEAMQVIQRDPLALQIIGVDGYAEILREYFKGLDFGNVVPSKRELQTRQQEQEAMAMLNQQAMAGAGAPGGQLPAPTETNADGSVSGDGNLMQQGAM